MSGLTSPKNDLTAEFVRERIIYEPDTGEFYWRASGMPAGTINQRGYRTIPFKGRHYLAHRLAWLLVHGVWPTHFIDHANLNRLDNRLVNLRPATRQQNNRNSLRSRRDGLPRGVTARNGRFRAQITIDGRCRKLGTYDTPEAAHEAYKAVAVGLYGEFGRFK